MGQTNRSPESKNNRMYAEGALSKRSTVTFSLRNHGDKCVMETLGPFSSIWRRTGAGPTNQDQKSAWTSFQAQPSSPPGLFGHGNIMKLLPREKGHNPKRHLEVGGLPQIRERLVEKQLGAPTGENTASMLYEKRHR